MSGPLHELARRTARRAPVGLTAAVRRLERSDVPGATVLRRLLRGRPPARRARELTPPPGRYVVSPPGSELPAVLVVVLDAQAPGRLAAVVRDVALAQTTHMSFVPVFLTDALDVAPVREAGYACETVPARRWWDDVGTGRSWESLVSATASLVAGSYGAEGVHVLGDHPAVLPGTVGRGGSGR